MFNFKNKDYEFRICRKKVVKSYDNEGAMQTVKAMMKRGEQLDVKFYTNKDNYPCAWIGSKKIQGFCLILNQEGLSWLRTYLETGEAEDFGFNPNSVTAYGEGEDNDFQLSIFKQLILAGKALQFVPTFREYGAKITASAFSEKERFSSGWKGQKSYMIIYWKKN